MPGGRRRVTWRGRQCVEVGGCKGEWEVVLACFYPLRAFRSGEGIFFWERPGGTELLLPCGQCVGCRLERSRQWAIRCVHESRMHVQNSFLTLTYDDEHLPADGSLDHAEVQKFLKRLRKSVAPRLIRYYGCGEYGPKLARPHYHVCLFGYDFPDKRLWKRTEVGSMIYRSAALESIWRLGFSSIGDLTFESAAYAARYCVSKVTGRESRSHYERVDGDSGEITHLKAEYNFMSLKPGIGRAWVERFGGTDVFPHDRVVLGGKVMKPPRYYDKFLEEVDPYAWALTQEGREERAFQRAADNTWQRLGVRGEVSAANLNRLKRGLK